MSDDIEDEVEAKRVPLDKLLIDCTSMASFLVDLPPASMQGMRSEQPGFKEALAEILSNQDKYGDQAGITITDIESLETTNQQIVMIKKHLPALRKLTETLEETLAYLDDQRQRLMSAIAVSVESRAKLQGRSELLAKYEKARGYRSAIANKAAKTRRKKQLATGNQAKGQTKRRSKDQAKDQTKE